jgi:peroxiredoxin
LVADYKKRSATLVAISPQSIEHNKKLIAGRKLDFEVLYDEDNQYADQLGLKHGFPDDLKDIYVGTFGIDLDKFNNNTKWELPIPARFVTDKTGSITAADVNADYTVRPEPSETLAVLQSMG